MTRTSKARSQSTPQRRPMVVGKGWVQGVVLVMLFGFTIMGAVTWSTYTDSMPIPQKVTTTSGQARIFAEVVDVTGIVLSKLDGSAKGGIVVQVQRELGVPVKLIGLGEGPDDMAPFDTEQFVSGLMGE